MIAKIHEFLDSPSKWRQGEFGTGTNCMCLTGLIFHFYGEKPRGPGDGLPQWENPSCEEVALKVARHIKPDEDIGSRDCWGEVILWNDNSRRTFDEVKELCIKLDI